MEAARPRGSSVALFSIKACVVHNFSIGFSLGNNLKMSGKKCEILFSIEMLIMNLEISILKEEEKGCKCFKVSFLICNSCSYNKMSTKVPSKFWGHLPSEAKTVHYRPNFLSLIKST